MVGQEITWKTCKRCKQLISVEVALYILSQCDIKAWLIYITKYNIICP